MALVWQLAERHDLYLFHCRCCWTGIKLLGTTCLCSEQSSRLKASLRQIPSAATRVSPTERQHQHSPTATCCPLSQRSHHSTRELLVGCFWQICAPLTPSVHPSAGNSHTPRAPGSHTPARPGSHAASSKGGSHLGPPSELANADEGSWDGPGGPGSLSAGPSGFDDAFSSFKSRASSRTLGAIQEDLLSAQPSGAQLVYAIATHMLWTATTHNQWPLSGCLRGADSHSVSCSGCNSCMPGCIVHGGCSSWS
jgi:hypothetical protein